MAKMTMPQARNDDESHAVIGNKPSADGGTGVSPVSGHGQDGLPEAKIKDQSRQVIETKGSVSENKPVEWGRDPPSPARSSRA